MTLTRRAFGFGLLGSAALAVIGGLPLAWSAVDQERVLIAVIEACFSDPGLPPPASLPVGAALEAWLANMPPDVALQARGLFRLVEALPLPASRFSSLPVAERTALLEELAGSSLYARRLIGHSAKQLAAVAYLQHDETWEHLGYDGPLVGR